MTAKVKDYPGTGCPICWTRKNLNECIGSQYLTVQELTHMVSHWRTQINESGFGGELLNQMKSLLQASFDYFEKFSEWRMAHERAELFNFIAEDKSLENIGVYQKCVFTEGFQFNYVGTNLAKLEELYKQLEAARSKALGANQAEAKEAERFAQLTDALAIARQSFATTTEARQRYAEKALVYAANRKAKAQTKAEAKAQAKANPTATALKSAGCGCTKN